jgi:hypothetical protein
MFFDEEYFSTNTYENISFARYSQYWWSNRFYAILARRYGKRGGRLLEIGSGMGHLVGQLEDSFQTFGMDLNHWAVSSPKRLWRKALCKLPAQKRFLLPKILLMWSSSSILWNIFPTLKKRLPKSDV